MKLTLDVRRPIHLDSANYIGILYLSLPVVLFFALFTIYSIALPAACFLLYSLSRLRPVASERPEAKFLIFNGLCAGIVVFLSGSTGPLYVNSDWVKHYAIFNYLAHHNVLAEPEYTLRYYIGMYIAPAKIEQAIGPSNGLFISLWVWLGLVIFFSQLRKIVRNPALSYMTPVIFMIFSGADVIGYYLTGFMRGNMYHFEWWAGWIEYSSPFTSIIWSPQSTLPAWIAVGFLMQRPAIEQQIFVAPLLLLACLLWSPFAAIGIAPFFLLALTNRNLKSAEISILQVVGITALGGAIIYYLTFDVAKIPRHWIWNSPCLAAVPGAPCATLVGYLRFILLEVGLLACISLTHKSTRNGINYIAILILLLLPLVQIGANNELAMNASRPAICALIISLILSLESNIPWRRVVIVTGIMCGITTPGGEAYRALTFKRSVNTDIDLTYFIEAFPAQRDQYITTTKIWFLRKNEE